MSLNLNKPYQLVITTSNKSMWTLQTFAYLFNIYFSSLEPVHIVCESMPKFKLPNNYFLHEVTLPNVKGWPKEKWSDGLIKYLNSIKQQYVIIMLDDYWLCRTVDTGVIGTLLEFMKSDKNILRVDLTGDRLYAGGVKDYKAWGHYDLVTAPGSAYQMSLMPGLWNKGKLLEVLKEGWTPWQVELDGTNVLNEQYPELIVLGTRQWPMRIVNSLRDSREEIDTKGIDAEHLRKLDAKGWLKP